MSGKINVNGVLHDWESLTVVGPQGTFLGITSISWKSSQEKANRYGKGGVPRGVGRKNYEPSASMTLDKDEFERLCAALGGNYNRARFIILVYMDPLDASPSATMLEDVMINSVDESAEQGSEKIEVKLDLRVGMIKRNGQAEYN